jgi:hypothetical protein
LKESKTQTELIMNEDTATSWDHRIMDGVSVSLNGQIGLKDDVARLKEQIEKGPSQDKLDAACQIAVAFIRWAQDLKAERDLWKTKQQ